MCKEKSFFPVPPVLSVGAHLFKITREAESIVAADRTAAPCTAPLIFFLFEKFRGTMFLDVVEVVNHAHVITCAVPFIKVFQTPAREIAALVAIPDKLESELIAVFLHEGAMLTAGQAACAVFFVETLLLQIILLRLVADAQRTVHPAGSNKYLFHSESPRFIFSVSFSIAEVTDFTVVLYFYL